MNTEKKVTANREYKSTIFSMLFKDKEKLLSLYNALNNSHYTDVDELEIVTLENAIYMTMKNDLAFILDCKLSLYEHQSTPNPNMPLKKQVKNGRKIVNGLSAILHMGQKTFKNNGSLPFFHICIKIVKVLKKKSI